MNTIPVLAEAREPFNLKGWYGPLVIAWTGNFPSPDSRCPVLNKRPGQEGSPNPILYILREAAEEEWQASMRERGYQARPGRPGQRYFEVHVD